MDASLNYLEAADETSAQSSSTPRPTAVVEIGTPFRPTQAEAPKIPDYLRDIYNWAYLDPRNVRLLDRQLVVSLILWGQYRRLQRATFSEFSPGHRVLQPASVYGDFSANLARHLGPQGYLEVIDIAPIQSASCRRKLRKIPQASVRCADARNPGGKLHDAVCCYFLLHELPDTYKREVVDALIASVVPGGKVVFVDYHKPHWAHPVKGVMSLVFDTLEPFAKSLWHRDISDFATDQKAVHWRKETYFGGLYQKVVAERPSWT